MNLRNLISRAKLVAAEFVSTLHTAAQNDSQGLPPMELVPLEERIMLSASPVAEPVEPAQDEASNNEAESSLESNFNEHAASSNDDIRTGNDGLALLDQVDAEMSPAIDAEQTVRELVFVDESVENVEKLLADLTNRNDGRGFEVFVLDSSRNGLEQISHVLSERQNIDAVHIVSHGTDQTVQLGNFWLTSDNLESYRDSFSGWRHSLSEDADILLYGCDVAVTADGQMFVEQISDWTDADVAASDDLTGHDVFGGDWNLEYVTGDVEAEIAFSLDVLADWEFVLDAAVDNTSADHGESVNSVSVSHTTNAGSDRLLLVAVTMDSNGGPSVTNVTYGVQNLTLVGFEEGGSDPVRVEIWSLLDPTVGSANVVVNLDSLVDGVSVGATTFTGVDQTTPLSGFVSATGTSSTPSVNVSSAAGDLVFDAVAGKDSGSLTEGANQTELWDLSNTGGDQRGAASVEAGAPTVTMSWSKGSSLEWAIGAVSINSASVGAPQTVVVDTTDDYTNVDARYGDTSSIAALLGDKGTDGLISLREAIEAANNTLSTGPDVIEFNIAGTGVHTINVVSALTITDAVTIDASTDDSFAANSNRPAIELDGTAAGALNGLELAAGSDGSEIRGLAIQNFDHSGILVQSDGNTIAGNYIGLDADGTTIRGNNVLNTAYYGGIRVESDNNTIGGLSATDRNVISGNTYAGIVFVDASTNYVLGNYIGTDDSGTLDRGNSQEGIDINRGGSNIIGGSNVNARNIISGNDSDGMEIDGSDNNVVQGNYIGTDYTGTLDLGNTRDGIDVNEDGVNDSTGNLLGGTGLNEGNLIYGNDLNGIEIRDNSTLGNTILGNRIYGNGALGIELGAGDGVTLNDSPGTWTGTDRDPDSGSNNLQNFPVLSSAQMISGTDLNVIGSLDGVANSYYRIEFFVSTTGDGTGYGEGQSYLDYANVTTDGSGYGTFNKTITESLIAGQVVSATATKSDATFAAFTDTSEFGQNIAVANTAPVATDDAFSTNVNTTLNVGPTSTNLANWWQLEEGAGQTTVDSGTLGNDATLGATTGVDTDDPTWSTGYVGTGGLTFDGTTDYVATPSTVMKTASSFTMSAWFKTTTTSGVQHILWEGYSGGDGFGSAPGTPAESELSLTIGNYNGQADKIVFSMGYEVPASGADPIYIISDSDFTDTTKFHNVAVTVTDLGGGVFSASLYVDGVLEGTDTGIQNDRSAWGALQIGKPGANTRYFSGEIDDVRIYDTNLSAAQVQEIAQSGVLQNDYDFDSRPINVNTGLVTWPSNGTLSINADGSFSYTPNADFTGTDTFTYQANDGSLDSNVATVTITVTDVNAAPVLDDSKTPVLTATDEDAGVPSGVVGTAVSDLVDFATPSGQVDNVTDADSGAGLGIAITAADTTNGTWFYSINNGSSWNALGAVSDANARLLAADAGTLIYFQPNSNYSGTIADAITFRAWDKTSGTNGGTANTMGNAGDRYDSFTAVSYSNNEGSVDWTSNWVESEPDGSPSAGVIQITGGRLQMGLPGAGGNIYREADLLGASTATVTGTLVSNGLVGGETVLLQVSGNGGASYATLYTITSASFTGNWSFDISAYIAADTRIRLYDNTGGSGSLLLDNARITSDGNSGAESAFSVKTDTASISINPVADTPTVTGATTNEDTQSTSGLVISRNVVDGGEVTHFKITGIANGTLYKNDGTTQITNGTFITFTEGNAGLKFTPDTDFNGSGNFTIQASTTNNDSGLGGSTTVANITVNPINDAPTLGNGSLAAVNEDTAGPAGEAVSTIFSGQFGDIDSGSSMSGIAVIGNLANPVSEGAWQYSSNGGTNWFDIGPVADDNTALAISVTSLIRFVPVADFQGVPTALVVRGLDDTYMGGFSVTGASESPVTVDTTTTGGTTAIAATSANLTTSITAVNDAPTLNNGSLTAVNEDTASPSGEAVSTIFSGQFGDVDSGASMSGIAVIGNTANAVTEGVWQYSTNAGTNWFDIGTVADDNTALAVSSATLIRFVPVGDYNGTPTGLTVRGLDNSYVAGFSDTSGSETRVNVDTTTNGGTTAIAAASASLDTSITAVSDAPVLDDSKTPVLTATNEDAGAPGIGEGSLISSLVDFATPSGQVDNVTDADNGAATGIAITSADATNGTWFYSINNGSTWNALGAVSDTAARLLAADADTRLYFQANADYHGTVANAITFHAWDQTSGSNGGTADLTSTQTVRDEFSTVSYSNNDGTQTWNTDWIESDSTGGGFSGGFFQVSGNELSLKSEQLGDWIYREADLSGASSATLSFDYTNLLAGADQMSLQVSGNGGASYTTIETFSSSLNTGSGSKNYDISSFIALDTRIRFLTDFDDQDQFLNIDNVQIMFNGGGGTGGNTAFSTDSDTASLVVNPVADTPSVTNATTDEDTQSTTGLVISRNVVDGAEVTHYKITGITDGTLYKNDGVTQITNGSFITVAEGNAGLKFTPTADFNGNGNFTIQASTTNNDSGLGGSTTVANITVNPINDAPTLGNGSLAAVNEDTAGPAGEAVSTIFSGQFGDIDSGSSMSGIAVIGNLANPVSEGAWQYSSNGGTNWFDIGPVADDNTALAISVTSLIRFVPVADFQGVPTALVVRGLDDTYMGSFSVTGASESPVTVDTTTTGGTTAIAATSANLTTSITNVNDAPVESTIEGGAVAYNENDPGTQITGTIAIADLDDTNIESAVVQITGNYANGEDVLAFTNTGTITGVWNAVTGTMTLTGSDTLANYEAALRSITYQNSSDDPSALTRTVSFTVNDGDANSNTLTRDIDVTPSNDAPIESTIEGTNVAYNENDPATQITGTIAIADLDDTNIESAVVQITGNYANGEDLLAFTNTGTITGVWNAVTGTMTLTGSDTLANYEAALRSITYQNSSDDPSGLTRTVSFTVNDGDIDSNTLTRDIDVTPSNDAPVESTIEGTNVTYNENDPGTQITGTIAIADLDDTNIESAVVQITGNYTNGEDVLSFTNTGTITGVWNAVTGTMTLTGSDTLANYEAALRSITYQNSSDDPSGLTRTVSFTVNDGDIDSNTLTRDIDVTPSNDAPVESTIEGTNVAYNENEPATQITNTIAIADLDDTNIESAVVQITGNYTNGEDVLAFTNTGTITGVWNAVTGTMTLTGSDTLANYEAALRSITYQNSSDDPSGLTRTVSFTVNDGDTNSNTLTRDIDVTPSNDAPVESTIEGTSVAYNENDPATQITNTIAIADLDDTNIESAVVQITGNYFNGEDILAFTNTGTITGVWNAVTGTMTLTGSDTLANYEAALRSITYQNSSDDPSGLTRTVSFTVNDGDTNSNTLTRDIDVTPSNDAPVESTIEGINVAYNENDPATQITGTIAIADLDDTNIESAVVQITGNYFNGEDILAFTNTGTITGVWNAVAGTMTLTGSDTLANYEAALRSITYQNSSDDPSGLTRTVSFTVNDGDIDSNTLTRDIDVMPINDAPVESTIEGTNVAYNENDPATQITGTIAIGDLDDTNVESAVVQITGNYANGEDVLAFTDTGTITGVWNAVSGTMTLTGSDTLANYEAALRSITYQNSSDDPSGLTRTVSFTVNDGNTNSNTLTRDIDVTPINDAPVESTIEGTNVAYNENDPATQITNTISIADLDDTNVESAVAQITGNYTNGEDVLAFTNTGTITGVWNAVSGTMTLTGSDTLANYQAALRSITYENTSDDPSGLTRTVSFTVNDGDVDSNTLTRNIDVTPANDAPVESGIEGTNLSYTEGDGQVDITGTIAVADFDDTNIESAVIQIAGNYTNGQDFLAFTNTGTITGVWNAVTGTMTLSGSDTLANYEAALRNVSYENTSATPSTLTRTVSFTVNDGDIDSNVITRDIDVSNSNNAPVESGIEGVAVAYTENDPATQITNTIAIGDVDDTNIESAVVQITGNFVTGQDVLAFTNTGTITGVWNGVAGTMTLSGSDTLANYEAALRSITYQNTSDDPTVLTRTVSFTVNDGDTDSNTLARDIDVTPVNDAPVESTIEGTPVAYAENDPATQITNTIAIGDVDDTNIESAVVQITGNFVTGQDVLAFTNTVAITGVWDGVAGTMTLTGSDTLANYQAALRSITYQNTSDDPSNLTRTVSFTVNDGDVDSNTQTRDIDVTPVNDAPVESTIEGTPVAYTENDSATQITNTIAIADADDTNVESAVVQITGNFITGQDVLAFTNTGTITGIWNAVSGTMTLTGSDTLANYQAALRSITYQNTSDDPTVLTRTVSFTVNDGDVDSNTLTRDIDVTPVNDAPVESTIEGTPVAYAENDPATQITNTIAIGDVDDTNIESAVVQITGNFVTGQDVLAFTNTVAITGVWDGVAGTMTLSGSDTLANYEAALRSITYVNTSDDPSALTRTVSFTVNDGDVDSNTLTRDIDVTRSNDAPVESTIEGTNVTYNENDPATQITNTIAIADLDDSNIESAVIQITGNYANGQDILAFTNTGTITGVWNAIAGTLTLSGSDTLANYELALRAVTYQNTSDDPSNLTRTVSFTVNDGDVDSNTQTRDIDVTPVNDAPVESTIEGTPVAYTENDSATQITNTIAIADADDTNVESAVVQITGNFITGQDVLAFTNTGTITGIWNAVSGTMTLTGSDTLANYQAALRSITYQNTSDDPSGLTRTVSFTVNDGDVDSNTQARDINVTPSNDAPVESAIEGVAVAYTENDPATQITNTIAITDVDDTNIESAVVQITGNFVTGQDVLAFTNTVAITGVWDGVAGTMTLSGSDTLANYEAALRSITYQNTSDDPSNLTRTVSFTVNDGDVDSNTLTRDIVMTPINDAPVESTIEGGAVSYTENDPATQITNTIAIADADDTNIESAVVQISGNFVTGQDVLAFTNTGTITGIWNAVSGTMTLTGSDTLANYQAALRSITYENTSEDPSGLTRTVSFTVNDGDVDSNTLTRDINVTPNNDAPVESTIEGVAVAYTENDPATQITNTISIADVDDTNIESAVVTITGNYANGQDVLAFTNTGTITGVWNAGTGTMTLTGSDTLANYEAALRSITYQNTSDAPSGLTRTVSFTVNDGDVDSNTLTRDIDVTPSNDAPTITGTMTGQSVTDKTTINPFSAVNIGDVDSPAQTLTVDVQLDDAAKGVLTNLGGFVDMGSGVYRYSGTAAAATTAIQGLTFDPTENRVSPGLTETTSFTIIVDDSIAAPVINTSTTVIALSVNDEQTIDTNTGLTLAEGSTASITSSELATSDVDHSASQLVYTVAFAPGNGQLELTTAPGVAITSFTQDDVDSGRVVFVHDDSETTGDSFDFSVDDGVGSSSSSTFTITVSPVNDNSTTAISDNDGGVELVIENAVVGTTVGITAFADDLDAGDIVAYSLDDDDGGRFAIDMNTGVVTVAGVVDRELDGSSRNITVRATSTDASFQTRIFSIAISDVDEFDVGTIADVEGNSNQVNENVALGTSVGITASASDGDATNNTVTYSLQDDDGGRFSIESGTGIIRVAGSIDRESDGASRSVTVRATSTDGSSQIRIFTIAINDVDEFDVGTVTDTDPTADEVAEDAALGTAVGITAFASDDDATNNAINYLLDDDAGGRFSINGLTGEIVINAGLDYETSSSHTVILRANSSDGSFTTQSFVINVTDVNEAPVATGEQFTLNQIEGLIVFQPGILGNDTDVDGDLLSATLVNGPSNGTLALNADGSLTYSPNATFFGTDTMTYVATDGLLDSAPTTVEFVVLPVGPATNSGGDSDGGGEESTNPPAAAVTIVPVVPPVLPSIVATGTATGVDVIENGDSQNSFSEGSSESAPIDEIFNTDSTDQKDVSIPSTRISSDQLRRSISQGIMERHLGTGFIETISGTPLSLSPFNQSAVSDQQDTNPTIQDFVVGSTAITTTALSVGYVLWLIRGGSLVASFVSTLPAWTSFDPLPIVSNPEAGGDRESLADIVDKSNENKQK